LLNFFTNPYPDELLYSAIARYHLYIEKHDCKDTLEELIVLGVKAGGHVSI